MDARVLRSDERAIFDKLLESNFPGRDELRAQLDVVLVREIDDDGCLGLECIPSRPAADVRLKVPTEVEYTDADGIPVHILLHVADGFMKELEMFKEDGSRKQKFPEPGDLTVFAPYSEAGVVWPS